MKHFKKVKLCLILIILVTLIYFLNKYNIFKNMSPGQLKNYIESFGMLGPLVYIILFTIVPLTLFPDSILAISGGMCFGLVFGSIYTMIGAACGGTFSFFLSRWIGSQFIKNKTESNTLKKVINEKGFLIVLLLRLIPLFPFDVISYGAGLSNIKYKDFILATLIGIIPGVLVFNNIGTQVSNIGSKNFYISIALLIILVLVGNFFKKKLQVNMK